MSRHDTKPGPRRFDYRRKVPNNGSRRFIPTRIKKSDFRLARPVKPPSWWAAVRSGLVRDPSAKHYRALRRAIWLFLYFIIIADRTTGTTFRKLETIATETGFRPRSIQRWLTILRRNGYVTTHNSGRSLEIEINKWQPTRRTRGHPYG